VSRTGLRGAFPPRNARYVGCYVDAIMRVWLLLLFVIACTPTQPSRDPPPVDAARDDAGVADAVAPATIKVTVEPDGTGVAQPLLTAIEEATSAVHVEMYLLTNDRYLRALELQHRNGLDVKVVLNHEFPPGTSVSATNARAYAALQAAGVDVRWAPTDTGFDSYTHEKAVLIDPAALGRAESPTSQVWIMTMNLDGSGPRVNREYLVADTNAADIAEAEAIFEADYEGVRITPAGSLVVAPSPQNNAASALLMLIESATTSLDVEAEELDDKGVETTLFDAIMAKARSGVDVRVVLEDSSSGEQASAVAALEAAGVSVTGHKGNADLDIHAKAVVADGARAYVGSENFSGGSLGYNRELGVMFSDPAAVAAVGSSIARDFELGASYSSR